jgi:hypothetical protein
MSNEKAGSARITHHSLLVTHYSLVAEVGVEPTIDHQALDLAALPEFAYSAVPGVRDQESGVSLQVHFLFSLLTPDA